METELKKLLTKLDTCEEAHEWASDQTILEAWLSCPRGDWMLWVAQKVGVDYHTLTLARAACSKLVYDLMMDPRSKQGVEDAVLYGADGLSEATYVRVFRASQLSRSYGTRAQALAARAAIYACVPNNDTGRYSHHSYKNVYYTAHYTALAAAANPNDDRTFEGVLAECADICRDMIPFTLIQEKVAEKLA